MDHMKTIARITALALCLVPTVASAEKLTLKQISGYLNQMKSAKGSFTQMNPDNTRSTGEFMIKRPGRMRFEYAAPNPALVVASSGQIAIFDKKSSAGPQGFPIGRTPLAIILKKRVNLRKSGMVIAHIEDGLLTKVTAQDPKHPDRGLIELAFSADPIELREWVVTDQSGQKTTVILGELDNDARLEESLFDIDGIAVKLGQASDR
jgi:outer membrane lipoprotein-sorting protein